jgi:O-antigen/teichoic acid export membrane protein
MAVDARLPQLLLSSARNGGRGGHAIDDTGCGMWRRARWWRVEGTRLGTRRSAAERIALIAARLLQPSAGGGDRGSTAKSLGLVVVPKLLSSVLQVGLNLLLAYHFGPGTFGKLAVCLTAIVVVDAIVGAAFDAGVIKLAPLYCSRGDEARGLDIERSGILLKLIGWGVIFALAWLFAAPLGELFFQSAADANLIVLAAGALLGTLLFRSVQTRQQIAGRFADYAITELALCALRYGGIVVLLLVSAAPAWILGWYGAASALVVAVSFAARREIVPSTTTSRDAMREVFASARVYLLAALLGLLVTRMDVFIVSANAGVAQAGIFSAAQIVALIPQMLGAYASVVLSARVMPLHESGLLLPVYQRWQAALWILAVAGFVLVALPLLSFGPALVPDAFRDSVTVAALLLPAGLAAMVTFPFTLSILLFLRPSVPIAFDLVAAPLLVAAYLWAVPRHGAAGAACVSSVFGVVRAAGWQWLAFRTLRAAGDMRRAGAMLATPVRSEHMP